MNPDITPNIAKQLRQLYFGGNWTAVNFRDQLADVTWQQAVAKVYTFNTIATLVYHTNYYIDVISKVLQGEPLTGTDKDSFNHPPVQSEEDWKQLLDRTWVNAENFAVLIEAVPDSKLPEIFFQEKYGTYYRNLYGVIEHAHYHLGQIVLIKKMLQADSQN